MTIIVDVKNEILGNSEFWRGDESRISEIRNIPARELARLVVADGQPRVSGMWHVRQETRPNAGDHAPRSKESERVMDDQITKEGAPQAGDAVFAFASMLTALPRVVPFGSAAWATPGVELAVAFNAANGLSVSRDFPSGIVFPKIDGDLFAVVEKATASPSNALREALWICVEHNALHFGETHNTVVQGRAALASAADPKAESGPAGAREELREGASYESMNLAAMVLSDCGHSSNYEPLLERVAGRIDRHVERLLTAQREALTTRAQAAPAALAHQGVVAWPVMPPSKGQSPVLFEDGYAEGWAKCIDACKAALASASTAQPTPPAVAGPLTSEQLQRLHHIEEFGLFCDYEEFEQIARAIEHAHGIGIKKGEGNA